MTNNKLKQAVLAKLKADTGSAPDDSLSFDELVPYVERAVGKRMLRKQTATSFFQLYLEGPKPQSQEPDIRAFRPWTPKPHPRQNEIDAAQPPMMNGVRMTGNGKENAGYWTR